MLQVPGLNPICIGIQKVVPNGGIKAQFARTAGTSAPVAGSAPSALPVKQAPAPPPPGPQMRSGASAQRPAGSWFTPAKCGGPRGAQCRGRPAAQPPAAESPADALTTTLFDGGTELALTVAGRLLGADHRLGVGPAEVVLVLAAAAESPSLSLPPQPTMLSCAPARPCTLCLTTMAWSGRITKIEAAGGWR